MTTTTITLAPARKPGSSDAVPERPNRTPRSLDGASHDQRQSRRASVKLLRVLGGLALGTLAGCGPQYSKANFAPAVTRTWPRVEDYKRVVVLTEPSADDWEPIGTITLTSNSVSDAQEACRVEAAAHGALAVGTLVVLSEADGEVALQMPGAGTTSYTRTGPNTATAQTTSSPGMAIAIPVRMIEVRCTAFRPTSEQQPVTSGPPEPGLKPAGAEWWCTSRTDQPFSACVRRQATCEELRPTATEPKAYAKCQHQKRAACFTFYSRLEETSLFWCAESFDHCERARRQAASRKADFTTLSSCEGWD